MNSPTAADIDRATIITWPARVTEDHSGWLYLADNGVTGRVNAVWPLDWPGGDVERAIDDAEAWYVARGLAPRFKLTDGATAPDDLAERFGAARLHESVTHFGDAFAFVSRSRPV